MRQHRRYSGGKFLTFDIEGAELITGVIALLRAHNRSEEAAEIEASRRYSAEEVILSARLNWTNELIEDLAELFKGSKKLRDRALALIQIRRAPKKSTVSNLRMLPVAIAAWLQEDVIDGWVYTVPDDIGISYAYVVSSCEYFERTEHSAAYCNLKMNANHAVTKKDEGRADSLYETNITFHNDDVGKGVTVTKLMLDNGYLHEDVDKRSGYNDALTLFNTYQPDMHKQFIGKGRFISAYRRYDADSTWDSKLCRIVNDEDLATRVYVPSCETPIWNNGDNEQSVYRTPPIHPKILCFDLSTHENVWCNAANMRPYVYDPGLRDKLILPEAHRDLIDVLTTDLDVFMDDIIAGKSGGTAILCHGSPGLGKTLTAEVYAEVIERPLYRIHSGQLGITAQDVEKNLEIILKRAQRWGAVLLIDEADVYIRRRSDDLAQNAVVAGFLRTLEYFNGLLFMTTNRGDDVDDAIQSRMIALVKYEAPSESDACAIWRVLADQFEISLIDDTIKQLQQKFPTASGRDIKNLLKLTSKFCKQKNIPLDVEAFRVCAMFRGL